MNFLFNAALSSMKYLMAQIVDEGSYLCIDKIDEFLVTHQNFPNQVKLLAIASESQSYILQPPACRSNGCLFDRISVSTVLSYPSALDVRKSTGPNGLSSTFIKEVANKDAIPLINYITSLYMIMMV